MVKTTIDSDKVIVIKKTLEDLKNLSPKNILKLREQNLTTLEDLSELSVVQLKTLLSTTENKASQILTEARKSLPPFKAYSGLELVELAKTQQYLPLGCKALQALFGGAGLQCGTITEVYGAFASGKSQMGFTSLIRAVLPKPFGLGGSGIYVDTEGTFNIKRISEIAQFFSHIMPLKDILENIRVIKPKKSSEQIQIIKSFLENNSSGYYSYLKLTKPVKALVVDSLTAHFRAQYLGRGVLAERQQRLNQHLRDLHQFSTQTKCAVLVINQVMGNPDPFSALGPELAIGGNIVAHSTSCRVYFRKRKNYRLATMMDSAMLPNSEVMFKLGKRGIMDIDEEDDNSEPEPGDSTDPVDLLTFKNSLETEEDLDVLNLL